MQDDSEPLSDIPSDILQGLPKDVAAQMQRLSETVRKLSSAQEVIAKMVSQRLKAPGLAEERAAGVALRRGFDSIPINEIGELHLDSAEVIGSGSYGEVLKTVYEGAPWQ